MSQYFQKYSIIYGCEIKDHYKFKQFLGRGTQAEVSLYKNRQNKKLYAIKSYLNLTDEDRIVMMKEISILRQLKTCPGVIKLKRVYQVQSDYHIILEYAKYGSLYNYAFLDYQLDEKDCIKILKQLLEITHFMHQKGIIHRDLKPDNILLKDQSRMIICLSDFGLAIKENDNTNNKIKCGTPGYVDPAVLGGEQFSTKSDIFSLGCLFYNLLTQNHIFQGQTVERILFNNRHLNPQQCLKRQNSNLSSGCLEILNMMLERDQSKRPTAGQCLKHHFISKFVRNSNIRSFQSSQMRYRNKKENTSSSNVLQEINDVIQMGKSARKAMIHIDQTMLKSQKIEKLIKQKTKKVKRIQQIQSQFNYQFSQNEPDHQIKSNNNNYINNLQSPLIDKIERETQDDILDISEFSHDDSAYPIEQQLNDRFQIASHVKVDRHLQFRYFRPFQ
ncbi:serine threonine protein kinase [Stylonychia lemnae]|uniref:Serine threonine protein kinase n=1 Tax=Stylonychia lemnae TaxID=5949 RepID=A0A078B256_STYLE|nr:serine threonine protein kinase [Stylonychia lemnae]|eukprot:CDW87498.1 serine threonine protein kinase [Stylonychia lemnae]